MPLQIVGSVLIVFRSMRVSFVSVMLMPSAGPHQRPSDLFLANAERYIEAGLKYGKM